MNQEIEAAYAACREIARKEAKNFYYAFVALPPAKRDAICAVYAFMRRADDISDNESDSREERRRSLDAWLGSWHGVLSGSPPADPVLLALKDAQQRFAIPPQLLDQLVEGTATDLAPLSTDATGAAQSGKLSGRSPGESLATYATFSDLYRYCYLVASVVGLVCIRIFGYRDAAAEKLAEETGIAFQLTNILRDVREDAARGRLYLPLADLESLHVSPEEMSEISSGRQLTAAQRQVLVLQAERARRYYQSAQALLPLIAADSRPALWVLVSIYRRLLERIELRGYDVFSERVSVPTYEKLAILSRGMLRSLWNRLRPAAS